MLCLLWNYLKFFCKKEKNLKSIVVNVLLILVALIVFSTLEIIIRLIGEYFIFVVKMENTAKNVISYIFTEIPKVYSRNIGLPIKIIINELIVCFFAVFNVTQYIINVMKDIVSVSDNCVSEHKETAEKKSNNDVYIEKGYLIFSDKYCFAEGKRVVATVPYKNRLILFSEDLIKGFSEGVDLDDANDSATAFIEAAKNSVNIEIYNNMLSLEKLIHKELNFNANSFNLELFGDYFTIDFIE